MLKLRCAAAKYKKHLQPVAEFRPRISVYLLPHGALQFSSDPSPSLAVDWQSMFYRPCLYSDGDDWSSSVPPKNHVTSPSTQSPDPPFPSPPPPPAINFQDILNWTLGLNSLLLRKSESVREKEENWPSTYNKRCRNRWQDVLHKPRLENMKQNVSFIYENYTVILIYGAVLNQALKNQNYNNHSANQNKGLYFQ